MFGRKRFSDFYDDDLFLGNLKELQKKEEAKANADEAESSDEIRMEHADRPEEAHLVKGSGKTPTRKPLANPEAMPVANGLTVDPSTPAPAPSIMTDTAVTASYPAAIIRGSTSG